MEYCDGNMGCALAATFALVHADVRECWIRPFGTVLDYELPAPPVSPGLLPREGGDHDGARELDREVQASRYVHMTVHLTGCVALPSSHPGDVMLLNPLRPNPALRKSRKRHDLIPAAVARDAYMDTVTLSGARLTEIARMYGVEREEDMLDASLRAKMLSSFQSRAC